MANRIIFDATIDTNGFRREIDNMKSVAGSFFGDAKRNTEQLSTLLNSIGEEFNIPIPDFLSPNAFSESFEIIKDTFENLSPLANGVNAFVDDFTTAKDSIFNIFENANSASEALRREFNLFKSDMQNSASVIDVASGAFAFFISTMETATGSFQEIKGQIVNVVSTVNNLASALDIAKIKTSLLEIKTGLLTAAKAAFNIVAKANPIGLIITAIGLLVAAIIGLIKNWDDVKAAVMNFVDSALEFLSPFIDWMDEMTSKIGGFFSDLWGNVSDWASDAWENTKNFFGGAAEWMKDNVTAIMDGDWGALWINLQDGASKVGEWLREVFASLPEPVQVAVTTIKNWFGDMWEKATDIASRIGEVFRSAWEGIKEGVSVVADVIREAFQSVFDFIREVVNKILGAINGLISGVVGGINTIIRGLNSINFTLPDWFPLVGGNTFAINIPTFTAPQIPLLARGGIVDQPTLAMIGERGREAVMPLENNTGWITDLANSIGAVVGAQLAVGQSRQGERGAAGAGRLIQLYLDGTKFAEAVIDDLAEVAEYRDMSISLCKV